MKPVWQVPSEIRMVPSEPVPHRLFVCLAKIKPEAGAALKSVFESGENLPKDLKTRYNEHLLYTYDLGEKGSYWEAGPATDFTGILHIFSTGSLEEAQGLMHHDPFYRAGIFYDDWWFEWAIHTPFWRTNLTHREMIENLMRDNGLLPVYATGVRPPVTEIKVEIVTPPKLFVSLAKTKADYVQRVEQEAQTGKPLPAFLLHHVFNRLAPGGTGQMGYDWEGGPSVDYLYDLSIFSVNSMETAHLLRENDHFSLQGIFYDLTYFEWCILMPLKKASPAYKETLKWLLKDAGAKLAD